MNQADSVLVDSSALIALQKTGLLGILPKHFSDCRTTTVVLREVGFRLDWMTEIRSPYGHQFQSLCSQVDEGEASLIAAAIGMVKCLVVLDDRLARKGATSHGCQVVGTIGLLILAKREGVIGAVMPEIEALRSVGFYLSDSTIRKAREVAGE